MKENGFNAVRSSHNLCSASLLGACDKYGMYLMDETFDMWYLPKTKYDYHTSFMEHWKEDLTAMVERDRNHPSVIFYSIGNEISEPCEEGSSSARRPSRRTSRKTGRWSKNTPT